jgi:pimeloyl-ACP methyl ester carboxylesterase
MGCAANNDMEEILESFCTPPAPEETDYDRKALEGAVLGAVRSEARTLVTYTWGEGKGVLLAHGWGSRASHMALIARGLARRGFRAVAFDAPAHGRSRMHGGSPLSNGFEFGLAIRAVADAAGPFTAVIAHSLSAAAAVWVTAGLGANAPGRRPVEKLVLLSTPAGINQLMQYYCARTGRNWEELKQALEREFSCRTDDYQVEDSLAATGARILMIHDEEDAEAPVATALDAARAVPTVKLVLTKGLGHGRVLAARETLRCILSFLENGE